MNASPTPGIDDTSVGAVRIERRRSGASLGRALGPELKLLDRITSWFRWSGVLMLLLLSGVMALLALPMRTWFEFMDEDTTWTTVQVLLVVTLVIQLVSVWEQRHFRALRDRQVEQMDAATEQRARADQFYGLSILDPLTGLYNRRFGERRLGEEISRAATTGDPMALVALDFDRFKAINDQHGHAAGDTVLKEFSRRLRRAIRASDVPIRVGGDEFLVILPECPTDQVQTVLSRLTAFDLKLDDGSVHVSYSRGVARYQVGDTVKAMIKRADERLYENKAQRSDSATADDRGHESRQLASATSSETDASEPSPASLLYS